MKKDTKQKHDRIINDMMHYIYKYIDTDINIDQLALEFGMNKFHLHRIFKEQIGDSLYATIKSIRLQKASNLLITNRMSTITEIANMCGYSSQTSFIRAFKERFNQTPSDWRHGGFREYSNKILNSSKTASLSTADFSDIEPVISKMGMKKIYYIRQKGYNRKLVKIWQQLLVWVLTNDIEYYEQVAMYHDNPIITPIDDCYYIAAIALKDHTEVLDTTLSSFEIPAGIYAAFDVTGQYGDILKFIQWAYHEWLPNNRFETTPNPAYSVFEKNHFLDEDGQFKLKFYLPIRYI